ncbi:MARVEL domain-containing protein [Aspergillus lucknowensis]|uniref:Membrane-associating domain-containing protein n=1 Tax=Aspergillus lucknowensis TaxID=176173 RepID=A0ABR4LG01_9EURO
MNTYSHTTARKDPPATPLDFLKTTMAGLDSPVIFYILRAVQALFAIIVLGLAGHAVNEASIFSPDSVNFMLFNGIWTFFIVVPYFVLAPIFVPAAAHRFALPAVDGVTMIFWFAGFIALAVDLGDVPGCSHYSVCQGLQAAAAFGAFDWVLFVATTVLNALAALRRDPGPSAQPPTASVP